MQQTKRVSKKACKYKIYTVCLLYLLKIYIKAANATKLINKDPTIAYCAAPPSSAVGVATVVVVGVVGAADGVPGVYGASDGSAVVVVGAADGVPGVYGASDGAAVVVTGVPVGTLVGATVIGFALGILVGAAVGTLPIVAQAKYLGALLVAYGQ